MTMDIIYLATNLRSQFDNKLSGVYSVWIEFHGPEEENFPKLVMGATWNSRVSCVPT